MVFALAGDSTMTSDCEPAGAGESSSSCTPGATCLPRLLFRAVERVALRVVVPFLEPVLREAIWYSDQLNSVRGQLPLSPRLRSVDRLIVTAGSSVVVS